MSDTRVATSSFEEIGPVGVKFFKTVEFPDSTNARQ